MAGEAGLQVSGYRFGNQIYDNLSIGIETGDYSKFSENMGQVAAIAAGPEAIDRASAGMESFRTGAFLDDVMPQYNLPGSQGPGGVLQDITPGGGIRTINGGVDFCLSPDLYPTSLGQKNIVLIEYTGSRRRDFGAANVKAGTGTTQKPPADYSWHHLDDYDAFINQGTMQLIKQTTHEANYPHNGGVSQYKQMNNKSYK